MLDRASTYIGSAVVLLAARHRRAAEWTFPLAVAVSTYGCLETLMIADLSSGWRLASLLGHLCIPLACLVHGPPAITPRAILLAAVVLLGVLCAYVGAGRWPYTISRPLSALFVLVTLGVLSTHRRGGY